MAVKGTKSRKAAETQDQKVLNEVKSMTFDTVTKELAGVQVELQQTLAELSGKLAEQWQKLEDVQKAIELKHEELKELHDIEAAATNLDDLQAQIQETKEQWEEDKTQWQRDFAEMKSEQKKVWAREEQDYLYTQKQKQRTMEDTLLYEFSQKEKANREKQEQLQKSWDEREIELKKREQELAELRLMKEQQPEVIKKAENAAVAVASNSIKKEYEHKSQISQKDAEMEKRLADLKVAADQQTIEKLQTQVADLKSQVEQAQQRVTDISTKALDSASGRATSEALQRMMETEKMSGKATK